MPTGVKHALILLTGLLVVAPAAPALELALPSGSVLSADATVPLRRYAVPVGPFEAGNVPSIEIEGAVRQQAWRIPGESRTSLQIMRPLREQITDAGYELLLDCAGPVCGGFDFRFGTEVLTAPHMFVDLVDYQFLSAQGTDADGRTHYVTLIASPVGGQGYIQMTDVVVDQTERSGEDGLFSSPSVPPVQPQVLDLQAALLELGHVVLTDLAFESGSDILGPGPFESLERLAAFLAADEARRVALVGHTDAVGALETNVDLSRRRADAVLKRLVDRYGASSGQLESGGMGYLAPVAPNLTAAGREANRRVEAVLLNTQ